MPDHQYGKSYNALGIRFCELVSCATEPVLFLFFISQNPPLSQEKTEVPSIDKNQN